MNRRPDYSRRTKRRRPSRGYSFPEVNRIAIAGRLVQDPPLRWTRKGVPVTNFIIATEPEIDPSVDEETKREPCFVSVVVWANQAIQCNKNLSKGNSVLILGELQSMPNYKPERDFYPVQINAQWIQYLDAEIAASGDYGDEQSEAQ